MRESAAEVPFGFFTNSTLAYETTPIPGPGKMSKRFLRVHVGRGREERTYMVIVRRLTSINTYGSYESVILTDGKTTSIVNMYDARSLSQTGETAYVVAALPSCKEPLLNNRAFTLEELQNGKIVKRGEKFSFSVYDSSSEAKLRTIMFRNDSEDTIINCERVSDGLFYVYAKQERIAKFITNVATDKVSVGVTASSFSLANDDYDDDDDITTKIDVESVPGRLKFIDVTTDEVILSVHTYWENEWFSAMRLTPSTATIEQMRDVFVLENGQSGMLSAIQLRSSSTTASVPNSIRMINSTGFISDSNGGYFVPLLTPPIVKDAQHSVSTTSEENNFRNNVDDMCRSIGRCGAIGRCESIGRSGSINDDECPSLSIDEYGSIHVQD